MSDSLRLYVIFLIVRIFREIQHLRLQASGNTMRELVLPVAWLIGGIGTLGGVISVLAGIIWTTLRDVSRFRIKLSKKLQVDMDRLSKGCGHIVCIWRR